MARLSRLSRHHRVKHSTPRQEAAHRKFNARPIILIAGGLLALVLFGGGKLAGLGGALGKSIKDFKSAVKEDEAKEPEKDEKKE